MVPSCRHLGWRLRGEAAHIDSIEASLSGWQSTLPNSSDTQRIGRFAQGMPLSLPLTGFAQFLTELLGAAKEPDDVNRISVLPVVLSKSLSVTTQRHLLALLS